MSQRTNHPLKSLLLLAVVAAIGWGAYEFVYRRGILKGEPSTVDIQDTRERVRSAILDAFAKDLCLLSVDEISYRAKESHFRIRVTLSFECTDQAREMCEEIASVAAGVVDDPLGVFAYDQAGNPLAHYVP